MNLFAISSDCEKRAGVSDKQEMILPRTYLTHVELEPDARMHVPQLKQGGVAMPS